VRDRLKAVGHEVAAGEQRQHARDRHGGGDVDRADARMGVGRTHEHGVGLSGQVYVVGVAALAGDEAQVLLPADRLPDAVFPENPS
jgi:hypothetical protein